MSAFKKLGFDVRDRTIFPGVNQEHNNIFVLFSSYFLSINYCLGLFNQRLFMFLCLLRVKFCQIAFLKIL